MKAFLSYDEADALAQADAADKRLAAGTAAPLTGIPIGIKDVLCVKDHPLQLRVQNSWKLPFPYDATAIQKLKDAGAIIFGRMNMDEFAMGSSTENSAFFTTRNPWDLERIPGGSSGGSAAAVAADECLATLGLRHRRFDPPTGRALRLCGLEANLWPRFPLWAGRVCFVARSDRPLHQRCSRYCDLARTHQWRRSDGFHQRSGTGAAITPNALDGNIKGLKLGIAKEYMVGGLDPEVGAVVQKAIDQLQKLGAEIVEISLPHTDYAAATYYIIAPAEASANLARFDGIRYGAALKALIRSSFTPKRAVRVSAQK